MHPLGRLALVTSFALGALVGDVAAQQPATDTTQAPQSGAQPPRGVQVTPPPGLATPPAAQPPAAQPQASPPPSPPPQASPQTAPQPQPPMDRRAALEVDVSALLGSAVRNAEGRDIGKVSRLMIDPRDGRVTTLVMGIGGTLGIGEKHMAVPFHAVKIGQDRQRLVVTIDQRLLDQVPRAESQPQGSAAGPATKK